MRYPHHIHQQLQEFAPYIGGKDAQGNFHHLGARPEARQRMHVFKVKNKHLAHALPELVLGHVVADLIVSDLYDVEYIGLERDIVHRADDATTTAQKDCLKKMAAFQQEQQAAIDAGRQARYERLGLY